MQSLTRNLRLLLGAAALIVGARGPAEATTVQYALSDTYTYNYTLINDTLGAPISEFLIYFPDVQSTDALNYSLTSGSAPSGWSATLYQPSAIDLGGVADFVGGSLAAGDALSGFAVNFAYLGTSTLGTQFFEVYDSAFNVLDRGWTSMGTAPEVPEPATLTLFGLGLVLLTRGLRHHR